MRRALVAALVVPTIALAMAACGSDASDSAGGAGGDVDRVPGQVVDADSVAVSPDGRRIAAGCNDALCVWDTADGSVAATYDGGNVVAWSPDGDLLATSGFSDDGSRATVVLLDAADGAVVRTLAGHEAAQAQDAVSTGLTDLAFSPDGSLVASAGHDGAVRLWSVAGGEPVATLETASTDPDAIAFSPDGDALAVAGPGAPVELWDVDAARRTTTLGEESAGAVAWRSDSAEIATAARDAVDTARLRWWDPKSGEQVGRGEPVRAYRIAYAPDGSMLAMTLKHERDVQVLPDDGGPATTLTGGHEDQPRAVAWSPDGDTLYSVSPAEGVLSWDPVDGSLIRAFDVPTD